MNNIFETHMNMHNAHKPYSDCLIQNSETDCVSFRSDFYLAGKSAGRGQQWAGPRAGHVTKKGRHHVISGGDHVTFPRGGVDPAAWQVQNYKGLHLPERRDSSMLGWACTLGFESHFFILLQGVTWEKQRGKDSKINDNIKSRAYLVRFVRKYFGFVL